MRGRGGRKEGERQGLRDRQTDTRREADSKGQRHSQKETELDNERARFRFKIQNQGRDTHREREREQRQGRLTPQRNQERQEHVEGRERPTRLPRVNARVSTLLF